MSAVGIAGLPASGKSRLMDELALQGYIRLNDINRDWTGNLPKARSAFAAGNKVAISDIMFCRKDWREKLEREIGAPVEWIYFQNDAWQCAKNCLYRFIYEKPYRPFQTELQNIYALALDYAHPEGARPVVVADAAHSRDRQPSTLHRR